MPAKQFSLDDNLVVTISKRKSSRNLRLSIKPDGAVHVSIPLWATYRSGVAFARSRQEWIMAKRVPQGYLIDGQIIGRSHRLHFVPRSGLSKPASRLLTGRVIVNYPRELGMNDTIVQRVAEVAAEKALRKQATAVLPGRLAELAAEHDFTYKSVKIKRLKSRWGSCDQDKNIVFNLFMMQLSDAQIDYVIFHELTHTNHLNHSTAFWADLAKVCPSYKRLRREVHAQKPIVKKSPDIL
ncbi:MAG: hypothetical protein JWM81_892 [Candidatus Saccharibacteria bacterium]|nr:hypothetical protein [Candidatus Saccharibacteria bacterium]